MSSAICFKLDLQSKILSSGEKLKHLHAIIEMWLTRLKLPLIKKKTLREKKGKKKLDTSVFKRLLSQC